jgi:hypothetical protein
MGQRCYHQTRMGAQDKHGILYMVEKDEVYWFISQS